MACGAHGLGLKKVVYSDATANPRTKHGDEGRAWKEEGAKNPPIPPLNLNDRLN